MIWQRLFWTLAVGCVFLGMTAAIYAAKCELLQRQLEDVARACGKVKP